MSYSPKVAKAIDLQLLTPRTALQNIYFMLKICLNPDKQGTSIDYLHSTFFLPKTKKAC